IRRGEPQTVLLVRALVQLSCRLRRIKKIKGEIEPARGRQHLLKALPTTEIATGRCVRARVASDRHLGGFFNVEWPADECLSIGATDYGASRDCRRVRSRCRNNKKDRTERNHCIKNFNHDENRGDYFLYKRSKYPSSSSFFTKLESTKSSGREAFAFGFFGASSSRIV